MAAELAAAEELGRATSAAPPTGRPPAGRPPFGRLAVGAVVLALGTLALQSAWLGPVAWIPLFVTSLAGLVGVWLLRRAGTSVAITALAALVVPLLLLAVLGRGEGGGAWTGISNAFPILLTSPFPAPVTPELLAPGLALAWVGGAIAGAGLTRRTFVVAPLLAGLLLLVTADLLTAGGSDRYGVIALGLVTVPLAHWAGMATRGRGGLVRGGSLALVLGVFTLLIGLLPLGQPFQPRDLIRPPITSIAEPSPLPLLGHWGRYPDEEILRRTGDDYPVHLVVLPDYNGVTFDSRSEYVPLGVTAEPVLPAGRFQTTVETTVTWRTTSRWLPAPGVPIEVSVPDALVDVDTGSLITPEAPSGGVISYTVRGQVDAPRLEEVAAADVGRYPRYTTLAPIPPEFVGYAREVTKDADSYLQQAQALERAVKGGRAFDPDAPGGSSYSRLQQFLFDPVERGGRRGTSEQFATAYAVLARSVGLPTRVVVGFGAGTPLETDPETNVVRGRDALAWPEVYFQGYGWVPFNPTPDLSNADTPVNLQPDARRPEPAPAHRPIPQPEAVAAPAGDRWWLVAAGLLVALGGPATGLALARRSRTSGHREQGSIGAWLKVEDALVLSGRLATTTQPAPQRATALGIPGARQVAVAAEMAAFAPAPPDHHRSRVRGQSPARGAALDDDHWAAARRVEHALRADATWWRRWLWPINPAVWFGRGPG